MRPHHTNEADRLTRALRIAQQGNHALAETEFRAILAASRDNIDAKFGLATVLAASGRLQEAVALLTEIVGTRPRHLVAQINLGNALLQLGNHHEAELTYRSALKLQPDSLQALFGIGCVLQQRGHTSEAETCFRKALQIQPENPWLWMNLGTALRQQHKLGDAVEAYRKATRMEPNLHQGWSALGQTLLEFHRPQEAEQAFRQALALAPQGVEAWIGLGDTLRAQQHDDAALEQYAHAISLDPASQNAHTKMEALLLRKAGSAGEASMFERLIESRIYGQPDESVHDALALLNAYTYPLDSVLEATRALLREFDPERLYPGTWWKDRLLNLGNPAEGHDKIFRGISSAVFSWSPPALEALEAIAVFTGDSVLHSFGAGTGYWEWLLQRHFDTRIRAGDRVLRRRFIEMTSEDYATATVAKGETVFLAWIPQGADVAMNLLRQIRPGQKLVIVGQGPDSTGKARICATDNIFRFLETAFESAGSVPLGFYSYVHDDVRMYSRR